MPPPVENHAAAVLWTARVSRYSFRWLFLFHPIQGRLMWREVVYDNEINTHISVTTENITHFDIKFLNIKI